MAEQNGQRSAAFTTRTGPTSVGRVASGYAVPDGPEDVVLPPIEAPPGISLLPEFRAFLPLSHDTVEAAD
jgi:hypothetical protein